MITITLTIAETEPGRVHVDYGCPETLATGRETEVATTIVRAIEASQIAMGKKDGCELENLSTFISDRKIAP